MLAAFAIVVNGGSIRPGEQSLYDNIQQLKEESISLSRQTARLGTTHEVVVDAIAAPGEDDPHGAAQVVGRGDEGEGSVTSRIASSCPKTELARAARARWASKGFPSIFAVNWYACRPET